MSHTSQTTPSAVWERLIGGLDPNRERGARWVLFDDCGSDFGPLSSTRLAFEHRAGALTQVERVAAMGGVVVEVAAPGDTWAQHADRCVERDEGHQEGCGARRDREAHAGRVHLLHGLASLSQARAVLSLPAGAQLVDARGRLIGAACSDVRTAREWVDAGAKPCAHRQTMSCADLVPRYPWELLDQLPTRLGQDTTILRRHSRRPIWSGRSSVVRATEHGRVLVAPTAHLGVGAVLDGEAGLVFVGDGAHIGASAVLQGPCVIHRGARVAPHALIKPNTVVGPECRVGGEIGGSILYGYSNATHHGHIGDSIIGEWVNIGAGTCISNLLNTYGPVVASLGPHAPRMPTSRTHYGGVIGDHAKVAILVALPTGFSVGVGAMVAVGRAPQTTPDFAWLTPERSAVHRLDRFLETESSMMARRNVTLGAAHRAFLESLHRSRTNG